MVQRVNLRKLEVTLVQSFLKQLMENRMENQDSTLANSPVISVVPTLLKNVEFHAGTLREARKLFSAQLAPDFNLFNFLRHDEMGLSSAIADLLDPNGTHGQGNVFLGRFVRKLEADCDCADFNWILSTNDWHVSTEKTLPDQRRLDIYMESLNGLIAIENKPWAGDQVAQLKDYAKFLDKHTENKHWLLIYLGNSEPSKESIEEDERRRLEQSFNLRLIDFYFLAEWLDECATQARALPVRVFIEELAKFVRIEVNGDIDMSDKIEVIKEIRKSQETMEGAFLIFNAMYSLKKDLLEKFHLELNDTCLLNNYVVKWDPDMVDGRTFTGFSLRFDLAHRMYLRMEFQNPGLRYAIWGICKADKDVAKDDGVWKTLNEIMSPKFGASKSTEWWPWYSTASNPRMKFGKEFEDWNKSAKPWIEMENGDLVKRVVSLADEVKKALSDANSLDLLK
jgi:hypothetical protein